MATEQMSLGDILSDAEPTPPPPPEAVIEPPAGDPPAEAPPTEKQVSKRKQHQEKERLARDEGKVRGPDGKFVAAEPAAAVEPVAPAEPAKPAQPSQDMTEKEKAFLRAAQEERTKRQELERRLAALEKPAEPAKTFWDDPEGALKASEDRIRSEALNTRLQTAEAIAKQRFPDFDEKVAIFREILAGLPPGAQQIQVQQWLGSLDPATYAYNLAKNHTELKQAGDLEGLRKDIEAKARADERSKVEAEFKAKAEASAKERAALPGSLSDARGMTGNKPVWAGPTSLENILKG